MADDEIERLLREVNAINAGGSAQPPATSKEVAQASERPTGAGGRVAFAAGSAVLLGAAGWFGGLLMPFVGSFSAGVGAAFGAFAAALLAGPPRWFSS